MKTQDTMILPYVLAYMVRHTKRGTEVLLSLRNAQASFGAGHYAMVGGKIDEGEAPTQALIREVYEETGCTITTPLEVCQVLYFKGHTKTCLALVFKVETWQGTPENKEPEKHDSIAWYPVDDLPTLLLERHAFIIQAIQQDVPYAEWGFGE